jgi:hypothetical protein
MLGVWGVLFVVSLLIVLIGLSALWIWLVLGIRKQGWLRVFGSIALQLSFVALVFGFLVGDGAFLNALLPPLLFPQFLQLWLGANAFLSELRPTAAIAGGITLAACLIISRIRIWCVAPSLLVALFTGIVIGENVSKQAMRETAASMGIEVLARNSLWWSLRNTPREFQWELHAEGKLNSGLIAKTSRLQPVCRST